MLGFVSDRCLLRKMRLVLLAVLFSCLCAGQRRFRIAFHTSGEASSPLCTPIAEKEVVLTKGECCILSLLPFSRSVVRGRVPDLHLQPQPDLDHLECQPRAFRHCRPHLCCSRMHRSDKRAIPAVQPVHIQRRRSQGGRWNRKIIYCCSRDLFCRLLAGRLFGTTGRSTNSLV